MVKKIIAHTKIKRESGFLYYTGTDENGYLTICKSEMGWKKDEAKKTKE